MSNNILQRMRAGQPLRKDDAEYARFTVQYGCCQHSGEGGEDNLTSTNHTKHIFIEPMSKTIAILLFVGTIVSMTACVGTKQHQKMTTDHNTSLFPKGEKLSNEYFTGDAFLTPLVARDKNNDFVLGNVTFEPGARTNWHTHPKGQVLLVTEGEGFYQEKGKSAKRIKKGDVINIPEDIEHWHGASATGKLVHIALTNYQGETNVVWLNPVSEVDYNEVNKH